jgi:hypothetical protein
VALAALLLFSNPDEAAALGRTLLGQVSTDPWVTYLDGDAPNYPARIGALRKHLR